MGITALTKDLCARHAQAGIVLGGYGIALDGLPETGPASAGIVFGVRAEQLGAAADTAINTRVLAIVILAGEGAFGAFFARDLILFRAQLLLPFAVAFINFVAHLDVLAGVALCLAVDVDSSILCLLDPLIRTRFPGRLPACPGMRCAELVTSHPVVTAVLARILADFSGLTPWPDYCNVLK